MRLSIVSAMPDRHGDGTAEVVLWDERREFVAHAKFRAMTLMGLMLRDGPLELDLPLVWLDTVLRKRLEDAWQAEVVVRATP